MQLTEEQIQEREQLISKASYYAIIPAAVRYHPDLSIQEKFMYAEITALSNAKGYCYASNNYFSLLYVVSKRTVSRWITNLEEKGLIKVEVIKDEKGKVSKRKIYLTQWTNLSWGYRQNCRGGIDKNVVYNNIYKNNINNNIYSALDNAQSGQVKKESKKQTTSAEEVEKIWKLYPLKKGKAQAIKKIPKLLKTYGYEQLVQCIEKYKAYVELKQRTDFPNLKYQNGSTFFNSGYMDYIEETEDEVPIAATKTEEIKKETKKTDIDLNFWD